MSPKNLLTSLQRQRWPGRTARKEWEPNPPQQKSRLDSVISSISLSLRVAVQNHISWAESPLNQLFSVLDTYKSQELAFWSVSRCLLSTWGDLSSLTFPTHSLFDKGAVSNKYNPKLLQKSILRAPILSPPFWTAGSSFPPPALLFPSSNSSSSSCV